jgi:hypothetical protein
MLLLKRAVLTFLFIKTDFISLMTTYVSELNTGIPMNLEEAVISASIKHNEKVYTSVLRWLRNEITFIPLPIPLKEVLQTKFFQLQDEMIRLYRKDAYPYGSACLEAKLQVKRLFTTYVLFMFLVFYSLFL